MSVASGPHDAAADDPLARELLRAANQRNYHWPAEIGGFVAELRFRDGDRLLTGRMRAPSPRALELELPEATPDELRWVETELRSLIGHRLHRSFEEGDGRYRMSAEPQTDHPYGRQIILHDDPYRSRYRVRDGLLRQASREVGERRFTLSIQAVQDLGGGQTIAQHYSVAHFAGDSGRLIRSDVYADRYDQVDGIWLPALRQAISADDQGLRCRELIFAGQAPLRASSATPAPQTHEQLRGKLG